MGHGGNGGLGAGRHGATATAAFFWGRPGLLFGVGIDIDIDIDISHSTSLDTTYHMCDFRFQRRQPSRQPGPGSCELGPCPNTKSLAPVAASTTVRGACSVLGAPPCVVYLPKQPAASALGVPAGHRWYRHRAVQSTHGEYMYGATMQCALTSFTVQMWSACRRNIFYVSRKYRGGASKWKTGLSSVQPNSDCKTEERVQSK
jgi:hypothetical protein